MAQEHLPDLIICDIDMPNLDGYGTLKAMRTRSHGPDPVCLFVRSDGQFTIRKGMELGADDYLTKPFSPKEFMAIGECPA